MLLCAVLIAASCAGGHLRHLVETCRDDSGGQPDQNHDHTTTSTTTSTTPTRRTAGCRGRLRHRAGRSALPGARRTWGRRRAVRRGARRRCRRRRVRCHDRHHHRRRAESHSVGTRRHRFRRRRRCDRRSRRRLRADGRRGHHRPARRPRPTSSSPASVTPRLRTATDRRWACRSAGSRPRPARTCSTSPTVLVHGCRATITHPTRRLWRFEVTAPEANVVSANGTLVQRGSGDVPWIWESDDPMSTYLVHLVIGDYDLVADDPITLASGRQIPITNLVPAGTADAYRVVLRTDRTAARVLRGTIRAVSARRVRTGLRRQSVGARHGDAGPFAVRRR